MRHPGLLTKISSADLVNMNGKMFTCYCLKDTFIALILNALHVANHWLAQDSTNDIMYNINVLILCVAQYTKPENVLIHCGILSCNVRRNT